MYNRSMIEIKIPGRGNLTLEHLVMDVNGTLAVDGVLIDGVAGRIEQLKQKLDIHLLTANTHGLQDKIDTTLNLRSIRINPGDEDRQKVNFVEQLGRENVIAIGQGANDALMLKSAEIGVCVLSREGTARVALDAADLVVPDINAGLDLLEKPLRLIASLRK